MDMDPKAEVKIDDARNKKDFKTVAEFGNHFRELIKHCTELEKNLLVDKRRKREIKAEINRLSIELDKARLELKPWDEKRFARMRNIQATLFDRKIMCELIKGFYPKDIIEELDGSIKSDEDEIAALKEASRHLQEKVSDFETQIKRESQEFKSLKDKIRQIKMDINRTRMEIDMMEFKMKCFGSRLWTILN